MMIAIPLTLIILFIVHYASAFTPLVAKRKNLIVVGNTNEALAAAMSICALGVLFSKDSLDEQQRERQSPVPPAQSVAFFNRHAKQQSLSSDTISSLQNALLFLGSFSLESYEQILANALQVVLRISDENPMFHTSIEFGSDEGAKNMQSLFIIRDRLSFIGLNLNTHSSTSAADGMHVMSREIADEYGNRLATLLDGNRSPAAVTMDISTHLALLQANSLPRSRGVLGNEKDAYAIHGTIQGGLRTDAGGGMLMEYNFDYADPFGGCDPLLCPSIGSIISSPVSPEYTSTQNCAINDAYAAAYSAAVASGIDSVNGVCVATSVKAVFQELGAISEDGTFCPPAYTWKTIDRIVECSRRAIENMRQENGLPRKMYKEFGYR